MIDSCDPSIATWSKDGTAFVVKDPEKFAAEIIGKLRNKMAIRFLVRLHIQSRGEF